MQKCGVLNGKCEGKPAPQIDSETKPRTGERSLLLIFNSLKAKFSLNRANGYGRAG